MPAKKNLPPSLANLEYENLDLGGLAQDQGILLTGFGCTEMSPNPAGGVDVVRSAQAFNFGAATVGRLPKSGHPSLESYSPNGARPAVCKGDSGGPLFTDPDGKRRVRAVNSTIDWTGHLPNEFTYVSTFAALDKDFGAFATKWLASIQKAHPEASICGLLPKYPAGGVGCRD
jgi:hypothetical protein